MEILKRVSIVLPKDMELNRRARMRLLWDGAHDRAAAREIRAQCADDPVFWVNGFGWTFDPRKTERPDLPFVTYPFQDEAILKILECVFAHRDVGIEKSRDMGASWVNLTAITWLWQFWTRRVTALVVSRNEDYVDAPGDPKSLFWKIDYLQQHQPRWLRPRSVVRTSMHFENRDTGSVIDGESTTGEVARGDRRTLILMDEYAAFDVAAGYKANTSTRHATDSRIFNSTPRGVGNAFYDLMRNGETEIIRMHWSQHPEKSRGLYKAENGRLVLLDSWRGEVSVSEKGTGNRRTVMFPEDYPFVLDGKLRSPWYDRQRARATSEQEIAQELDIDYLGSGYQFFDAAAVEAYVRAWCRDAEAVGDLEYDLTTGEPLGFRPNPKGRLSLWQPLGRDGTYGEDRRFVVGVDVSAGTGASNSAAAVYDEATREKWAEFADPNMEPRDFAVYVLALARFFNGATVVPDASGPTGKQFLKRFTQDGDHPPLYRRLKDRKISQERVDEYGVYLNPEQKSSVLIEYRDAIGDAKLINRSARAMEEALQFVRSPRGDIEHSAALSSQDPSGARTAHGDIVVADALANLALGEIELPSGGEPREVPPDSVAGRMLAARVAKAVAEEVGLGPSWDAGLGGNWK